MEKEQTTEQWKEEKRKKKAQMTAMQKLSYEVKIKWAELRAHEYIEKLDDMGLNAHVSVGGLDSIVLLLFLRKIGIDVPAISVSALEDKSIQKIHKQLGVERVAPGKSKVQILNECGFPVISKKIAGRIDTLQHPTEKNKTVRHAIITGECGAQGHYVKNSRMKMPKKWLELFGGYENENEGVDYQIAPFLVSNKCCMYMKEQPCDKWAKEHNSRPYLGLMASEGGQREESLTEHGCNYFGKTVIRSAPFAPFLRQDLLQLALDLHAPVPEIYGTIERRSEGTLYTTGAQRTGCSMCGFGVHMEKRPHREEKKKIDEFLHKCSKLNEKGLEILLEYMEMLLRIPEYRKSDKEIYSLLGNQPTAYDVDKVCRKINENKDMDNMIDADFAIKIVKSGGIE